MSTGFGRQEGQSELEVPLASVPAERTAVLEAERYLLRTWLMFEYKTVACFWFGVALMGFFLAIGGLSALQAAVDDTEIEWWHLAGMPKLPPTALFRLDWFAVFAQMILNIMLLSAVAADDWRDAARLVIVSTIASVTVLEVLCANRADNVATFAVGHAREAALVAMSGFIAACIANLSLIWVLGISW